MTKEKDKKRRPESPPQHSTASVGGLIAVLSQYPLDAKVYVTYDGCVEVWQGKKALASVRLTGY